MVTHIVLMFIRGTFLFFMALGFFYNSEVQDLSTLNHFVMSGVYGSFVVVTLGLLIETAMESSTDVFIERNFVLMGALFNLVVACLAFYEYYASIDPTTESMNKGFVSCVSCIVSLADLFILNIIRK